MGKIISHRKLTDTLHMTEDNRGFWLWDDTRKMNLAMYTKTEEEAFIKALEYYQGRVMELEPALNTLQNKVDGFLSQFITDDEND